MTQTVYDLDEEVGLEREHRWLGKKQESHYIPSWYRVHRDLEVQVVCEGKPQGMTVRNVLPYRRWAIDANGIVMSQAEFERQYLRYLQAMKMPETHQVANEHIPNVLTFVRARPEHGSLVDFAFDDDGAVVKTEKYTKDGDVAPEFLARQQQQAENSGALQVLVGLMKSGKLSKDDFAEEAARLLGDKDALRIEAAPSPELVEAEKTARLTRHGRPDLRSAKMSEETKKKLADGRSSALARAREASAAQAAAPVIVEAVPPGEGG